MAKNIKILINVLILIYMLNFVNAGLIITGGNNQNITKLNNQSQTITFTVGNLETFSFYNVTLESNSILSMSKIAILGSGQNVTVTANIISNNNFEGQIKVKGFEENIIGIQNKTYNVNAHFSNGLSMCDKTLIRGDKIQWINQVVDEIQLVNAETAQIITTIQQDNNYTTNFNTPEIFKYYFQRRGFRFTDICIITVISDTGFVNRPENDAVLNLKLVIDFGMTNITSNVLQRNYTMNFFESKEGIITLTNTGNKIAKNVTLTNDWFIFNKNNFDILPNEVGIVTYSIKPKVFSTNDTNKNYQKNVTIRGNFNDINERFDIFINFAEINTNSSTTGISIIDIIKAYCTNINPNDEICQGGRTVFITQDNGSQLFNVTLSQKQVNDIWAYLFDLGDKNSEYQSRVIEQQDNLSTSYNSISTEFLDFKNSYIEDKENLKISNENNNNILLIIAFFIILSLLIVIGIFAYKYKKIQEYEHM